MYRAGTMELESNGWMQSRIGDRPYFFVNVSRGFSSGPYHVFFMPHGILFLPKARPRRGEADGDTICNAASAGSALGGLVGAAIGAAAASAMLRPQEEEENYDMYANEQLIEIAKRRKRSFVSMVNEIRSVTITAPGAVGRMFGKAAGWITLRDSRLGTITIELKDQNALTTAVNAIPKKFGDKAFLKVRWDDRKLRFVPA